MDDLDKAGKLEFTSFPVFLRTDRLITLDIQLEEGSVANRYNLVENGDFSGTGTVPPGWWNTNLAGGDGLVATTDLNHPKTLDATVLKVGGTYGAMKGIGGAVYLSGSAGDTFSLGAWAKGDSVPSGAFDVRAAFVPASGSASWVSLPFSRNSGDWQYLSDVIKAPIAYVRIDIYVIYESNANTAWFDGIQLYKEEFGDSYSYDSKGNLTAVSDIAKNSSTFAYDGSSNLISATDPKGSSFTYSYDGNHNITQAASAQNVVYSFTYDASGNPLTTKIGDAAAYIRSSAAYTSDGNYISSMTDSSGNTVGYSYDMAKGTLSGITDANGKATSYAYDSMNRLTSVSKTADGQAVTNSYTYVKDRISQIAHNGFSYSFGYDSLGNCTSVAAGAQTLIANSYEGRTGKLLESAYGNGQKVSTLYDGNDNAIGKVYSGDNPQNITYSGNIQNVGMTTVAGNGTLLGTTGQGLRLESLAASLSDAPAGMHIKYQAHVQDIGWQGWAYDGATAGTIGQSRRMEAVCIKLEGAPAGYTVQYQVHVQGLGWMDPVQDGQMAGTMGRSLGIEAIRITVVRQRTGYRFDAAANLAYLEDYVNGTSFRYSYDLSDRLTRVEEPNGNYLAYGYDNNSNRNLVTEQAGGSTYETGYAFDKDNRPTATTFTRASENTITQSYDSLARLTGTSVDTGAAVYSTAYGYLPGAEGSQTTRVGSITNNGAAISYTYDSNGNIATITQNGQAIRYSYNELNEVVREDSQVLDRTVIYRYDQGGNILDKTTYPYTTGSLGTPISTVSYGYEDSSWKDKLTSYDGKAITYDAIGNPLAYDGWTFGWEEGRQLASMSGNGKAITCKYNDAGIRTSKTVDGTTTSYQLAGDRVISESDGTTRIHYTYDSSGNLVSMDRGEYRTADLYENTGSHSPVQIAGTGSAAEKLTAASTFSKVSVCCPSWNNNIGDLTLRLYRWDTSYSTTIAQTPVASKTFHDFTDNQWLELGFAPQAPGEYLWVLDNPSETVGVWKHENSTNSNTAYVNGAAVSGDFESRIGYVGTSYYYIRNAQGDIIGLFDSTGTQVVSYTYDTWGKLVSTTGSLAGTVGEENPYRYRGYRYDDETGLYYLQSRYYNPEWGRFVNADDIEMLFEEQDNLLQYNLFAYCLNNPVGEMKK